MSCPCCAITLHVIEFDSEAPIRIERCAVCFGLFFNPDELDTLLEMPTDPLGNLQAGQLHELVIDFGQEGEQRPLKCPTCPERMVRFRFGGYSGISLHRCGTHGVWLDGSDLGRLITWWQDGGDVAYRQQEEQRARRFFGRPDWMEKKSWAQPIGADTPRIRDQEDEEDGIADMIDSIASAIMPGPDEE